MRNVFPLRSASVAYCCTARIRAETDRGRDAYSGLHERVDTLPRELKNPILHDIANMSFRVEPSDRPALRVRWSLAAAGTVSIAQAAFQEAVKNWPDQRLTLRQGIMLIREHPSVKR